ncbi:hypothetical protein [Amycolatopsis eburnea]|uniref:Uncharacterized protein n=1 Tax=Amycolatopsis eburnea TaxID=2267691 RepID=A0A3R9E479_9PSEU|nr:hypothetical protein [Amycolatopsis eburnea]RSD19500.1 hypothetical protein EIY87_14450 [Amycolatopsis eburnea]
MDTHEEPITDEELARYAKGKFLLSALRLRPVYYRLLRETNGRDALWASAQARRLAPDDPELPARIRESVLRIGAYQIWGDVRRSDEVVDRVALFLAVAILAGAGGGAVFYADGSVLRRVAYAAIAVITSLGVCFVADSASAVRAPVSPAGKALLGLLGLGAFLIAGWWLLRWPTLWGLGLSSGIFIAVVTLFVLGCLSQLGRVLSQAAYRFSWARWTSAEITETLAEAHWWLSNEPEPHCLRSTSDSLEHVAICVERFLPQHLTAYFAPVVRASLTQRVQHEFAGMAARARLLSRECLLPKATTRVEVADEVAHLLVTAGREQWGEWDRADADEVERSTRWRLWLSGALRLGLGLLPLILVAFGAFYVYQTNPASPLLKAEVLAPVLVAALGFFTTVLSSGAEREKPGRRRKPFGGRKIGT